LNVVAPGISISQKVVSINAYHLLYFVELNPAQAG